jgi:hypothetical protein
MFTTTTLVFWRFPEPQNRGAVVFAAICQHPVKLTGSLGIFTSPSSGYPRTPRRFPSPKLATNNMHAIELLVRHQQKPCHPSSSLSNDSPNFNVFAPLLAIVSVIPNRISRHGFNVAASSRHCWRCLLIRPPLLAELGDAAPLRAMHPPSAATTPALAAPQHQPACFATN